MIKWLQLSLITLVYFLVYRDTFQYSISWDDTKHIMKNPHFQNPSLNELLFFWKEPYFGMYIPVAYDVWALIYWSLRDLFGLHFEQQLIALRLINWMLHWGNFYLLYVFLYKLFDNKIWTLIPATLFLFHPLNSELVLWISEFRGLLSTSLAISAMLCLLIDYKHQANTKRYFYLSALLLVLGCLSKPNVIVLFVCGLLYCFEHRRSLSNFLYYTLMMFIGLIPALMVTKVQTANEPQLVSGIIERLTFAGYSVKFYFQKVLWPNDLNHLYDSTSISTEHIYLIYLILCVVLILIAFKFHDKYIGMIMMSILVISPYLGVIAFSFQKFSLVANRYAYLFILAVAVLLAFVIENYKHKLRLITPVFVMVIGLYVLEVSEFKNRWYSESTLWSEELQNQPHRIDFQIHWAKAFYDPLVSHYISVVKYPNNEVLVRNYGLEKVKPIPFLNNGMDYESNQILNTIKQKLETQDFKFVREYLNSELIAEKVYHPSVIRIAILVNLTQGDFNRFQKYYSRYIQNYGTPADSVLVEIYKTLRVYDKIPDAMVVLTRGLLKYPNLPFWKNELKKIGPNTPEYMRINYE